MSQRRRSSTLAMEWNQNGTPRHSGESVRRRYYETTKLDKILQHKVASQLRENGVAETKVVQLSAKISQAVRDEVVNSGQSGQTQVTQNLSAAVNKCLDPILYGREDVTDLKDAQKPRDALHISNLILLKLGQAKEEVQLARIASEGEQKTGRKKKGFTPREEQQIDRSQLVVIKDNIEKARTEREILEEKLRKALEDQGGDDIFEKQREIQDLDAENYELRRDLQACEQDKQRMIHRNKEMQRELEELEKSQGSTGTENARMRKQIDEMELQRTTMQGEINRLTSERGRLQVMIDQKDKEIVHLRDPDRDMVHQLNVLRDEVTMLRTQTRRLNEEKGMLKSKSQKIENNLDDTQKHKNKLLTERDDLFKENQDLKQRYRKLALSDPKQRKLPEIFFTRAAGTSHSSLGGGSVMGNHTSRAPSRVISSRLNNETSMSPERGPR